MNSLTKKAIINSLCEAGSAMSEEGRRDFEKIIQEWMGKPADWVIAEAQSVFGYTHTNVLGFAVNHNELGK